MASLASVLASNNKGSEFESCWNHKKFLIGFLNSEVIMEPVLEKIIKYEI